MVVQQKPTQDCKAVILQLNLKKFFFKIDNLQGPTVQHREHCSIFHNTGFPGGPVVRNLPCKAEDADLIPGLGRSHTPRCN